MPVTLNSQELSDLLLNITASGAFTEAGVLLWCLFFSWAICALLRGVFKVETGVLLGRNLVDGVLFPVLSLVLAVAGRQLLAGPIPLVLFRLAIPILVSLASIRLTVRVLSAAFPNSAWMSAIERTMSWAAWLLVVLWITGIMPAVMEELDTVQWKIGGALVSLRNVIEGSLTAAVVLVIALWISAVIERKITHGTGDNLSMRKMVSGIVRAVLLFVGMLFALSAVGIDLTALSVLGGALGVGLGFGLQKIAANYVSGFVILAERSLRIGDMVKVDNFEGRITDIRTRYTVIRSLGGREAIIPNETLITQRVENASLADPRVLLSTTVQVDYSTDVLALKPKIEEAVRALDRVIDDPAPSVDLANFAADGLELNIQFWIRDPENGQGGVKSDVNLAVLGVLRAEGIEIPYPQRVVRMLPPVVAPKIDASSCALD